MNIINTNILSSSQYHEAKTLLETCKSADGSNGISFFESDMNALKEYPCFYLMYEDNRLVSFASVFIPEEGLCEVYANTLPEMRKKGYFTKILEMIRQKNKLFGIEEVYIANDPLCKSGTASMENMGGELVNSDILMVYNKAYDEAPKGILELSRTKTKENEVYEAYRQGEKVGLCNVEFIRGTAFIYGFEIFSQYRGKGYGSELLLLMLRELINEGCEDILLHVNDANKAAHTMYSHHGFTRKEQIDYWRI